MHRNSLASPMPRTPAPRVPEILSARALAVLERHPAPALAFEEIQSLLRLEGIEPPEESELNRALMGQKDLFRVLSPRTRSRWAGTGIRGWVLAYPRRPPRGARHVSVLLRESLRRLGSGIPVRSHRTLARWETLLLEEAELRAALERSSIRQRPPVAQTRHSTTPLLRPLQ